MKKFAAIMMGAAMVLSCGLMGLAGCNKGGEGGGEKPGPGGDPGNDPGPSESVSSIEYAFTKIYTKGELQDRSSGFNQASDIKSAKFYLNGGYVDELNADNYNSRVDLKVEFYSNSSVRIANFPFGYAFTLPTTEVVADHSIQQFRSQYTFGDSILTTSVNYQNPYTSNTDAWFLYAGEWLMEHINDDDWVQKNGLERTNNSTAYEFTKKHPYGDRDVKDGYDVYRYDIRIANDDDEQIERPYYNIAVIRKATELKGYALLVMKSETEQSALMDSIVQSFSLFSSKGKNRALFDAGDPIPNPNWSDETANYYDMLINAERVHWGVFSYSMPGDENSLFPGQSGYDTQLVNSKEMQEGIEELWQHKFDIYPTYTHLSWGNVPHHFPTAMATELAGGNGVNGKPVLQFTYQFTTNNNLVGENITPMFDIMRGKYDEHFRQLAKDIKEYGKPILFRVNNEMNTDWTSYCGMITLLDPDIFNMTWIRMYDIFEEEGVDNCIWIWNPIADSCPHSMWGEDLCYFPGVEYVQLLGGTNYEMNNYSTGEAAMANISSFKKCYQDLFNKNQSAFSKWVMILSEFACGSGGDYSGELGRNRDAQAKWVSEMFDAFAAPEEEMEPWAKSIKGAVWFNCNDYVGKQISNRLRFYEPLGKVYDDLAGTMQAFREGFAKLEEKYGNKA